MTVTVIEGKLVVDGVELPDGTVLNLVVSDDAEELWALYCEEQGDVVVVEETLSPYFLR